MSEGNENKLEFDIIAGKNTLTQELQHILDISVKIKEALGTGLSEGQKVTLAELKGIKTYLQEIRELSHIKVTLDQKGLAGKGYGDIQTVLAELKALAKTLGVQSQLANQSANQLQLKGFQGGGSLAEAKDEAHRKALIRGIEERQRAGIKLTDEHNKLLIELNKLQADHIKAAKKAIEAEKLNEKRSKNALVDIQEKARTGKLVQGDIKSQKDPEVIRAMRKGFSSAIYDRTLSASERSHASNLRDTLDAHRATLRPTKPLDWLGETARLIREQTSAQGELNPRARPALLNRAERAFDTKVSAEEYNQALLKHRNTLSVASIATAQNARELLHASQAIKLHSKTFPDQAVANQGLLAAIKERTKQLNHQRKMQDPNFAANERLKLEQANLRTASVDSRSLGQNLADSRGQAKVAGEQQKLLDIANQRYHTEEKIKALQPEQIKHARDTLNYQYQTAGADVARREEASRLLRLLSDVETMHRKALSTNSLIADLEKTHYKTKASLQNLNREELQQAVKVLDYRTKIAATEQQRAAAQALLNTANQNLKLNPEAQGEHREASRTRVLGDAGASLLTIQAGLMFNYKLLGGFQSLFGSAISSAIELDSAFRQLQAISAATNYEMATMKVNLIEVAQASKFSAAEVGNTAVLLAQAGLSIQEIGASMKGIITLAQATGTDLAKSVDVVTSVLSVFNKSASETDQIVNQLTQALNSSKLDIQKVALGIQYAGNISADAGVSFEELTSALGAMANAGIRSGSTLGTGMRQIIIDLEKPSKKLKDRMAELGLSLDDVDFKSQGLVGVLKNLREAGFTTADAFKTFEVRSAAAFSALSGNLEDFETLKTELIDTNAAFEANLVQMEALSVQIDHLKSNLGILAATGLQPITALTRDFSRATAHALETTGEGAPILKVFTTAIAGLITAVTVGWMAKLTVEIGSMVRATVGATSAVSALRLAFLALNPVSVGVYAGLGLVAAAAYSYGKELDRLNEKLDIAKGKYNEQKEALNTAKDAYQNVDTAMKHLSDKYGTLSQDNAALRAEAETLQEQFGKWGLVVDDFADLTLPKLMSRLGELRTELAQEYELTLGRKLQTAMDLLKAKTDAAAETNQQSSSSKDFLSGQAAGLRGQEAGALSFKIRGQSQAEGEYSGRDLRVALAKGGVENADSKAIASMLANLNDSLVRVQKTGKEVTPRNFNYEREIGKILSSSAYMSRNVRSQPVQGFLKDFRDKISAYNTPIRAPIERRNLERSSNRAQFLSEGMTAALNNPEAWVNLSKKGELQFNEFKAQQTEVKDSSKGSPAEALQNYVKNVGTFAQELKEKLKTPIKVIEAKLRLDKEKLEGINPDKDPELYDKVKNERDFRQQQLDILKQSSSSYDDDISTYLEGRTKARLKELNKLLESEKRKYAGIQKRYMKTDYEGEEKSVGRELKTQFDVVFAIQKQIAELDKDNAGALDNYQRDRTTALTAQTDIITEKQEAIKTYLAKKAQESNDFDAAQSLDKYKEAQTEWFKSRELDDELWAKSQKAEIAQLQARTERSLSANTMFSGVNKDLATRAQAIANRTGLTQTYAQYGTGASGFFANQAAKKRAEGLKLKFQQERLARGLVNEEAYTRKIEEETPKVLELKERKAKAITVIQDLYDRQKAGKEDQKALEGLMENAKKDLSTIDSLYDAHLSFLNQAKEAKARAAEQTQEALGYLKETVFSPQEELMKSVRAGQEAMTSGLSTIFGDWASGMIQNTEDVKDAFEAMGKSILQSMLKVVSDRTATMFTDMLFGKADGSTGLGMLGNLGLSLFGGFGSSTVPKGVTDFSSGINVAGYASTGGFPKGNAMQRFATGGSVSGTNVGHDTVPAMLMPNEYVLKPSATSALGKPFLDRLNATTTGSLKQLDGKAQAPQINVQGSPPVNVYVVSPDQANQMGANDVVIAVEDNISRNGSIKQLIKQVISGEA